MNEKFPTISTKEDRAILQEQITDKFLEKRSIIFSRLSMMIALVLIFIALYLLTQIFITFEGKEMVYFNVLSFILGIATQGIITSFLIKEVTVSNKKINSYKKKLQCLNQKIKNKDKYKRIENIARSLKYDSTIDENYAENYTMVIGELEKLRSFLGNKIVYEEINYILYLIFHGENNGFKSQEIVKNIEDPNLIKELLDYVMLTLRAGEHSIGMDTKSEEEIERFFLAIKKILEGRYEKEIKIQKNKEEVKEKKEDSKESIKKMSSELLDDDNTF